MPKAKKRADPFGDDDDYETESEVNVESLVQGIIDTPDKPKKLSLLLPKEPEDFFGDEENDDEEEKERQRQKEKELAEQQEREKQAALQSKEPISAFGVLSNLNPQELEDHYFKCIQLCNQNKVSIKNAFKLQLIDYMKLIFTKQSKKTENLALMGFTLDASAKIYSYRVDKVYSDMMKIMSGKVFKEAEEGGEGAEEDGEEAVDDDFDKDGATPKKKRKKQFDDEKELDFEKVLSKESDLQKNSNDGDGFLKERTTLPPHLEFFLECPLRNPKGVACLNGPVFDLQEEEICNSYIKVGEKKGMNVNGLDASEWLPTYKEMHTGYFLMGESNNTQIVNKTLMYDSSLEEPATGIRHGSDDDADMDIDGVCPIQMVDYDDGFSDDEPDFPPPSVGQRTMNSTMNKTNFSIKGMSSMISLTDNEYSFFDSGKLNFWAGPSHWSLKPRKRTIIKPGEPPVEKPNKKNFTIDFFNFDPEKIKSTLGQTVPTLSRKTLRTWTKEKNWDVKISFTPRTVLSLFHNENLVFVNKNLTSNGLYSAAKSKLLDEPGELLTPEDFNCQDDELEVNMLNDDNDDRLSVDQDEQEDMNPSSNGLELLPAPPKVSKININFSKSQKRVDIKLLKNTIWSFMNLDSNTKENIPNLPLDTANGVKGPANSVQFSDVFAALPRLLPPEEANQLSCGIVFMSVLHLANEKTLALKGDTHNKNVQIMLG